jgi:hypothetical protein
VTSDPHERARKLVALAVDGSASAEESRTAAVAACRLIAKHKLLDGGTAHPLDPPARRRRARRDSPERESYRAARPGTCAFCAKGFGAEDDVMTYVDGTVDHWHCAKRRAAGGEPAHR